MKKDIANILNRLTDLPTSQGFAAGSKLFVYQVVYSQNEGIVKVDEYYNTGSIKIKIQSNIYKL